MIIGFGTKAYLLYLDHGLVLFGNLLLFILLIPELSIIHNPTNGRISSRRNFYKVKTCAAGFQ
jgi:hypothetical protein